MWSGSQKERETTLISLWLEMNGNCVTNTWNREKYSPDESPLWLKEDIINHPQTLWYWAESLKPISSRLGGFVFDTESLYYKRPSSFQGDFFCTWDFKDEFSQWAQSSGCFLNKLSSGFILRYWTLCCAPCYFLHHIVFYYFHPIS